MCTNPWDNVQHVFCKTLHKFCRGTDMERHRWNATEELRDHRQQGDRDREENGRPPAGDVRMCHYEAESLMTLISAMGPNGLIASRGASCVLYYALVNTI